MYTVVIADNHPIALRGLRGLLSADFQVISETTDGLETVDVVTQAQPDLLILDLEMPGLVGFEVAKRVHRTSPDTLIIIYSGHSAFPYIQKAFNDCYAMGYVHKDDEEQCILDAIERALQGKRYLSPVVRNVAPDQSSADLDVYLKLYEELTDTEKELLHPLAEGYTAAQIARLRMIEESTVRTHIIHMKQKLTLSDEPVNLDDLRRTARLCLLLSQNNLLVE